LIYQLEGKEDKLGTEDNDLEEMGMWNIWFNSQKSYRYGECVDKERQNMKANRRGKRLLMYHSVKRRWTYFGL
jgi:hypothetical protein